MMHDGWRRPVSSHTRQVGEQGGDDVIEMVVCDDGAVFSRSVLIFDSGWTEHEPVPGTQRAQQIKVQAAQGNGG